MYHWQQPCCILKEKSLRKCPDNVQKVLKIITEILDTPIYHSAKVFVDILYSFFNGSHLKIYECSNSLTNNVMKISCNCNQYVIHIIS